MILGRKMERFQFEKRKLLTKRVDVFKVIFGRERDVFKVIS